MDQTEDDPVTVREGRARRELAETSVQQQIPIQLDGVSPTEPGDRYQRMDLLGSGGMGEVHLASDRQIGREVAYKVLHPRLNESRSARRRFLREARVQAQLEHPGVVPVYELVTAEENPYFTMQRVRGATLRDVLRGVRDGDEEFCAKYPPHRLLTTFERVVQTMAYAHSRGVVHRDLKPANIMLGEFGEVTVLDWGVAKVVGSDDLESDLVEVEGESGTRQGTILGTAGYMAPEQAAGESADADARADVYSLGAILFEILTGEALNRGGSVQERLGATLAGPDTLGERCPDFEFPPALERICEGATAIRKSERFASAGELARELGAYVDRERDTLFRRRLADEHLERAIRAADERPEALDESARHAILRELGSAVSLDPSDARATRRLVDQLLAPVEKTPARALAQLERSRVAHTRKMAIRAGIAFLVWTATLPLLAVMGVRSTGAYVFLSMMLFGCMGVAFTARGFNLVGRPLLFAYMVPLFVCIAAFSSIVGPLFVVPALAASAAGTYSVSAKASLSMRRALLVGSLAACLVPLALQLGGVLPSSYRFVEGGLLIVPTMVDFPPEATYAFLVFAAVMTIVHTNVLLGRAVVFIRELERESVVRANRLHALVPDATLAQEA